MFLNLKNNDMEIKHDKEQQKFFLTKDGKESYALYRMQDERTINVFRTYVPPEHRHQGLAGKILKVLLEYAIKNKFKVIPSCSYADYFIDNNEKYQDLLNFH